MVGAYIKMGGRWWGAYIKMGGDGGGAYIKMGGKIVGGGGGIY